jgi:hypothetical protein
MSGACNDANMELPAVLPFRDEKNNEYHNAEVELSNNMIAY